MVAMMMDVVGCLVFAICLSEGVRGTVGDIVEYKLTFWEGLVFEVVVLSGGGVKMRLTR